MSAETPSSADCQVDFYLLGEATTGVYNVACRLALMAWERKQKVYIIAETELDCEQLDGLMWQFPQERFLPHAIANDQDASMAPVQIGSLSNLNTTDVVINLSPEAVPQPGRFSRILEIVPYAENMRQASRIKFKTYRDLGINPRTNDINK